MRLKSPFVCLFFVATFLASFPGPAQSSSPQETLNQFIADLQKNPNDNALREKIIKLVLTMNSPPEVPAEAKKHISRGVAAVEGAKNPDDFKDACNEFQQVTTLAPWLGNGYRNLAIAQDKAGMYSAALQSLNLYLLTQPARADVEWAEDLKNKVEYRKEKAAKATSPEVVAAQEQNKSEDWLKNIDGRRYTFRDGVGNEHTLDVRGKVLVWNASSGSRSPEWGRFEIRGREFTYPSPLRPDEEFTFIISDDGDRITERVIRHSDGAKAEYIYLWQR